MNITEYLITGFITIITVVLLVINVQLKRELMNIYRNNRDLMGKNELLASDIVKAKKAHEESMTRIGKKVSELSADNDALISTVKQLSKRRSR